MSSFLNLAELHKQLDDAFADHQHALVRFDFDRALSLLQIYETALLAHMFDEENYLLPLYRQFSSIPKGGDAELFFNEHDKMRKLVRLFVETTDTLRSATTGKEELLIRLLDRQSFYKRLCSHHDIRECKYLFPALDELATDEQRAELRSVVRFQFSDLR